MRKLFGVAAAVALAGAGLAAYRRRERLARWWDYSRAKARLVFLCRTDEEAAAATPSKADRGYILQADHAAELLERACRRFFERPLFVCRDGNRYTYGEVWRRVELLAGALHALGVRPQDRVGLCSFSSVDWIVADMACLYLNAVSVPLDHQSTQEQLDQIVGETSMRLLFCADNICGRLRFPEGLQVIRMDVLERSEDCILGLEERSLRCNMPKPLDGSLHSIVYTSGSTGSPKGVMLPHHRWNLTLRDGVLSPSVPRIELGYLALAHMAGRITIYKALVTGGLVYLAAQAGMSNFLEDLAWARPTHLLAVPRVSQFLYQHYRSLELEGPEFHRIVLGGRLLFVHTGAAITADDVVRFMRRDLKLHVTDVYGSTEMGPVAVNGRIVPTVRYRLVDRPELGYTTKDRPFPRGELAIKSIRSTPGYFGNSQASEALYDDDGYLLSGDIVEEREPGRIVLLGRSHGVLRLGHGKFVQIARLEELYTAECRWLQQLYLHGEPGRDYLLAVAVPSPEFNGEQSDLLEALREVAQKNKLGAHEVPRDLLLEKQLFCEENGLLSAAQKPRRPMFQKRYGDRLGALCREIEERKTAAASGNLEAVVAKILGLTEVDLDRTFQALGGDSLAAAEVSQALTGKGVVQISAGLLLDPNLTLGQIARRKGSVSFGDVHGERRTIRPHELESLCVQGGSFSTVAEPKRVLLTGANGFLGRHLILELLRRMPQDGKLLCLVRGGAKRLWASFRDPSLTAEIERLTNGRLEVLEGDLSVRRLGLSDETYELASLEVESVLHAGALVNHTLSYRDLFEANVMGTAEIARFASTGRAKSVHFVSTAGLFGGLKGKIGEEKSATMLWPERPVESSAYASGYVSSKWAGEFLLDRLHRDTGLPVTINRCGLLLPGLEFPKETNNTDVFVRLFRGILFTGLAPTSFYEVPREYQALQVNVAAAFLAELALRTRTGQSRFHLLPPSGPTLDQMVNWASKKYSIERLPYSRFFQRFGTALSELDSDQRELSMLPILSYWKQPIKRSTAVVGQAGFQAKAVEYGLNPTAIEQSEFLEILSNLG